MTTLCVTHNSGFFSCCMVKLHAIINYINTRKKLPMRVDSSAQFEWYKKPGEHDVTYKYFMHPDNIPFEPQTLLVIPFHHSYQFINYSRLRYGMIVPSVRKYFTPSVEIRRIVAHMEKKYSLDYNNLCVLFYRGNDKSSELLLCNYNEYVTQARRVLDKYPETKFIIQSDETEFIEFMENSFPGSIVFQDEIRHMPKCNNTVDKVMTDNIEKYSMYFLAITLIMSRCRFVVCGSGNCSLWIMLYRENTNGVFQNLKGQWLVNFN